MSEAPTIRAPRPPERIVCLTEEPTEILYGLGEQERIVGISAFTVRPPEAPGAHPVVSAFTGGSVEKIRALEPDLCIGFSDIQGKLAREHGNGPTRCANGWSPSVPGPAPGVRGCTSRSGTIRRSAGSAG